MRPISGRSEWSMAMVDFEIVDLGDLYFPNIPE